MNQTFRSFGQTDTKLWAVCSKFFRAESELPGLYTLFSCQMATQKNCDLRRLPVVEKDPEGDKSWRPCTDFIPYRRIANASLTIS